MKISVSRLLLLFLLILALLGPASPAQDSSAQDSSAQRGAPEELETFVPTEKLPADSAISFPVDI